MSELFNLEKILGICEKICYFWLINFMFVVSNLPVLVFFMFVGIHRVRTYLPLFLLCMVFMAPALSAVFYAMNLLVRGTEGKAVRDYMRGYLRDYRQKLILGAGQMLLVFILWTNLEFFSLHVKSIGLTIVTVLLLAAVILVTPNLYMLVTRYEMKNLRIIKTAVVLMVARPVMTLGNVVALGIILMAFELSAGTTVLFMGSVYGFLVMFMNQRVLNELESQ